MAKWLISSPLYHRAATSVVVGSSPSHCNIQDSLSVSLNMTFYVEKAHKAQI